MESTSCIVLLCSLGCLYFFPKLHTFFIQYSYSYLCYNLSSSFSAFLFPPISLPLSLPLSSCRHSINQVIESIMRRWAGPRALDWVLWGPDLTVGAADSPVYKITIHSRGSELLFSSQPTILFHLCRPFDVF
jgi:hypothetical protein